MTKKDAIMLICHYSGTSLFPHEDWHCWAGMWVYKDLKVQHCTYKIRNDVAVPWTKLPTLGFVSPWILHKTHLKNYFLELNIVNIFPVSGSFFFSEGNWNSQPSIHSAHLYLILKAKVTYLKLYHLNSQIVLRSGELPKQLLLIYFKISFHPIPESQDTYFITGITSPPLFFSKKEKFKIQ